MDGPPNIVVDGGEDPLRAPRMFVEVGPASQKWIHDAQLWVPENLAQFFQKI
jgi:hypothetical protein